MGFTSLNTCCLKNSDGHLCLLSTQCRQTDKEGSSHPFYTYFGLVQIVPGRCLFVSIECEDCYELDAELSGWGYVRSTEIVLTAMFIWVFCLSVHLYLGSPDAVNSKAFRGLIVVSLVISCLCCLLAVFVFRKLLPFNHEHNSRIPKMMEEKKGGITSPPFLMASEKCPKAALK